MATVLKAFQGRIDDQIINENLPLPREGSLFTIQFRHDAGCGQFKKRYLYAHSKAEALKKVDQLRFGDYCGADRRPVTVTTDIDVLKTTTKLIHTTRAECDEDDENEWTETRGFDPNND